MLPIHIDSSMQSWRATIQRSPVIAVIRAPHLRLGLSMAKAVAAGGLRLVEVTWNSDRPAELIRQLRETLPECLVGAGTLTTREHVLDAIAAGAQFLFTPHVNPVLIQTAVKRDVPLVAGALTPTEIVSAWQAGAASVKVFPIKAVGGVEYIRCLREPLGEIPLIPTGGVTVNNTRLFLQAGAIAVGLAGDLFLKQAVQAEDWDTITNRARALMASLV
ncbi:MAG: bifunctional 4-hydroxy-2-oxoglutarate aldolase/2-dehydro-3-deoxy-phosphogluconate aldolase [Oscillatoriales cyanobacterium C42_A2020_001]|nr:bifunctional 4-hydroxy-2-oxoglutarate aldolase/2-dehydro-3-deoxy-phosphogluconate aldolase [Leptolyngbyaceae cyanobacterium C42_A2020_001]